MNKINLVSRKYYEYKQAKLFMNICKFPTKFYLINPLVNELSSGVRVSHIVSQELSVTASSRSLNSKESEISFSRLVPGVISLDIVDNLIASIGSFSVGISQEDRVTGRGDFLGVDRVDDESGSLRNIGVENDGVLFDLSEIVPSIAGFGEIRNGRSSVGFGSESACCKTNEENKSKESQFHVEGNVQAMICKLFFNQIIQATKSFGLYRG